MLERLDAVCFALLRISNDIPTSSNEALSYYRLITNKDFIITTTVLHNILAILNEINVSLQDPNLQWKHAATSIEFATSKIKSLSFSDLSQDLDSYASKIGVNLNDVDPFIRRHHLNFSESTVAEKVEEILEVAKENIGPEIEKRFSVEKLNLVDGLCALDAKNEKFMDASLLLDLGKKLEAPLDINMALLRSEISRIQWSLDNGKGIVWEGCANMKKLLHYSKVLPLTTSFQNRLDNGIVIGCSTEKLLLRKSGPAKISNLTKLN